MSSKTVKVTNGKIVNYTITAPGYKTINGSQLITADTTINKNMIAETDPNGVYSLGDRIGGIASFVCYFNSTNPETNVDTKYAVFVLDAKYRQRSGTYGNNTTINNPLPQYTTNILALNAKESATYNTNTILGTFPQLASDSSNNFYRARNAAIITINNIQYQSQLPNIYELQQIYLNRTELDSKDPTISDYQNVALSSWNTDSWGYIGAHSSTSCIVYTNDYNSVWGIGRNGNTPDAQRAGTGGACIPVFEIPVE